jgi:hypothetical protein
VGEIDYGEDKLAHPDRQLYLAQARDSELQPGSARTAAKTGSRLQTKRVEGSQTLEMADTPVLRRIALYNTATAFYMADEPEETLEITGKLMAVPCLSFSDNAVSQETLNDGPVPNGNCSGMASKWWFSG